MRQRRENAALALQPPGDLVGSGHRADEFQRAALLELPLYPIDEKYRRHSAAADFANDAPTPDSLPRLEVSFERTRAGQGGGQQPACYDAALQVRRRLERETEQLIDVGPQGGLSPTPAVEECTSIAGVERQRFGEKRIHAGEVALIHDYAVAMHPDCLDAGVTVRRWARSRSFPRRAHSKGRSVRGARVVTVPPEFRT
jgi:hypothetical protein